MCEDLNFGGIPSESAFWGSSVGLSSQIAMETAVLEALEQVDEDFWASGATPRWHCGYHVCLMPTVAFQLPAISVALRPQLPSPTTKQSVYQAGQGSHQQMGGTQEPAATRARAGPVRAISSDDKVLLDVSGIKHMAFYHSTSCLILGLCV